MATKNMPQVQTQPQFNNAPPPQNQKIDTGAAISSEASPEAMTQNEGLTPEEIAEIQTKQREKDMLKPNSLDVAAITADSHPLVRMFHPEPLDGVSIQNVHPFCVEEHKKLGWRVAPKASDAKG